MKTLTKRFTTLLAFLFLGLAFLAVNASAQTNRGAGVPPETLPKALKDLGPKDYFVSSNQQKVGVIHSLEGKVVVIHRATKEAYFAVEGDPIFENDSLNTLADSRCRIRLLDEDVITMAPDTEFNVDSFQDQRDQGKKTSLFTMAKGKAMFYAMRLFRYKDTRFNVNTPTVTVGVRGTKFGVEVVWKDGKTAQAGVRVADSTNQIGPYLAQLPPGGGQSFTNAHSEDGSLNVGGRIVPPGQMFNGQMNQVFPTPPEVIRSFQQATGMGPQGRQARTTPQKAEPKVTAQVVLDTNLKKQEIESDPNKKASSASGGSVSDETITIAQVQTGTQTETIEKAKLKEPVPYPYTGTLYGYFAALLRKNPFQDAFLNYQSGYSPGEFYNGTGNDDIEGNFRAHGVLNSSDYLKSTGVGGSGSDQACIGGSCGNWGESWNGVEHWIGQNDYAQWGYWKADTSTSFTLPDSNTYSMVNDQAWFVIAKHITTATEIAAIASGDYNYSGVAHGTYYNGSATARMDGNFSSTVHFGSAYVKDFNLSVSGGGHSASFVQSGTASISGSSSGNYFSTSSGAATIDGASVSYKQVSGSLVGSNAEGLIGAWGAACSTTGVGAAGIYSGTR